MVYTTMGYMDIQGYTVYHKGEGRRVTSLKIIVIEFVDKGTEYGTTDLLKPVVISDRRWRKQAGQRGNEGIYICEGIVDVREGVYYSAISVSLIGQLSID